KIEPFCHLEMLATALGRKLGSLIDSLYPLQVLQQLAAPTTQFFPSRPFHPGISALPAFVQVPRGPLKTCIWIEYDDFLQCHAATVPECMNQRNLSRWPWIMTDRAPLSCKLAYFGVCMASFEQEVHLGFVLPSKKSSKSSYLDGMDGKHQMFHFAATV